MTLKATMTTLPAKRNKSKAKMTKEERRKKYTEIARTHRQKKLQQQQFGGGNKRRFGPNRTIHGTNSGYKKSICYNCRQPGHNAINCPLLIQDNSHDDERSNQNQNYSNTVTATLVCYKCGSTEHSLSLCPKRQRHSVNQNSNTNSITQDDDTLPFATCFVCNNMGHLASQCPQNNHGIYVNGGSCRLCGSLRHLAKNCPDNNKSNKKKRKNNQTKDNDDENDDGLENLLEQDASNAKTSGRLPLEKDVSTTSTIINMVHKKKRRVVKF